MRPTKKMTAMVATATPHRRTLSRTTDFDHAGPQDLPLGHCLEAEKKDLTFLTFLTSDLFFARKLASCLEAKRTRKHRTFLT
jgi:hypothetical protein